MNQLKTYQIFLLFLLFFITFATFFITIDSNFSTLDDALLLTKEIRDYDFCTVEGLKNIFFKTTHYIYQPIVNISFSIELKLYTYPAIFHFDNIMLHIIITFLVFIIFLKLTNHFFTTFIIAALFAIHPVHVEVVAWISSRKDLIYSLFYLLSFYFYLKSYESKKNLFLVLSLFCFLLSNMSKPMAITLPAILILTDFFIDRFNIKNFKIYIPFIIISAIFVVPDIYFHYNGSIANPLKIYNFFKNVLATHFHYLFYLYKFILPINLYCSYPYFYPLKEFPPLYITLSPIVVYTGIYFLFKTLKYSKKIFFGFSFFIIVLLPSSGILPTGIVKVADRYCYLAYIGLFYLVAILIVYLYNKAIKYLKILLVFCCLIIFSILIYLSYERTLDWKNENYEPPVEKRIYHQESINYL